MNNALALYNTRRFPRSGSLIKTKFLLAKQSPGKRVEILARVPLRTIKVAINKYRKYIYDSLRRHLSPDAVGTYSFGRQFLRMQVTRDCGEYIPMLERSRAFSRNGTYEGDFGMHPSGAEHPIFHVLHCNRDCSPPLLSPALPSPRTRINSRKKAHATAPAKFLGVTAGNTVFTRINLFSDGLYFDFLSLSLSLLYPPHLPAAKNRRPKFQTTIDVTLSRIFASLEHAREYGN